MPLGESGQCVCGAGALTGKHGVDGRAEFAGDLLDIGLAALAPLDLQGADAGADKVGQDVDRVEADRVLEDVAGLAPVDETALADRRVTDRLAGSAAVDGESGQLRRALAVLAGIADTFGRRADAGARRAGDGKSCGNSLRG